MERGGPGLSLLFLSLPLYAIFGWFAMTAAMAARPVGTVSLPILL